MKTSETIALPAARFEYEQSDEQTARRTTEQVFASLHSDIRANRDYESAPASISAKKQLFLLMGA